MADEARSPNYNGTAFSLGISLRRILATGATPQEIGKVIAEAG
jgi:hypothetical protein